jgi:hypothetical protein
MTEGTPITAHVHACVKILNRALQTTEPSTPTLPQPMRTGYEAVFELVDLPWDEHTEEDGLFREGYETCLLDIVNAIANEWGVAIPELKVAHASQ